MKQVLSDKKELVLKFVKEVYKVCPKKSEAVWEFPSYPEPHLKQYCVQPQPLHHHLAQAPVLPHPQLLPGGPAEPQAAIRQPLWHRELERANHASGQWKGGRD